MSQPTHTDENPRNPGTDLDLDWALAVQANTSAIERRCKALPGRRSIKKTNQAAWLLKAITCIDLTTLSGDDTEDRVRRLCRKPRSWALPGLWRCGGAVAPHVSQAALTVSVLQIQF